MGDLSLAQWAPSFLGPGSGLVEDNFCTDGVREWGFGPGCNSSEGGAMEICPRSPATVQLVLTGLRLGTLL